MTISADDFLWQMFPYWRGIAKETCEKLGEEADLFTMAYSDALDIHSYVCQHYSQAEQMESLVAFELPGLWKELYWMQFLFWASNYPVVMGRLRFNWEQIYRAYHADTYALRNPAAPDLPGKTVDGMHEWLMRQEEGNRLRWSDVIEPALARFFSGWPSGEARSVFKPLWDRLSGFVHPSGQLRELLIGETNLKVRDGFDEALAMSTLEDTRLVLDLIWVCIVDRFPKIVPSLKDDPHVFASFPRLRAMLDPAETPPAEGVAGQS